MRELARECLARVARAGAVYGAAEEMAYEAAHQLLDMLGADAPDAVRETGGGCHDGGFLPPKKTKTLTLSQAELHCDMLLQWAAVLSNDVQFHDAPKDSVRVLQAAEKYCAAWALCSPARATALLDTVAQLTGTPLLRVLAVGRFFAPFLQRLAQPDCACARARSLAFVRLADVPAALLLDVWQHCPLLAEVRFISCSAALRWGACRARAFFSPSFLFLFFFRALTRRQRNVSCGHGAASPPSAQRLSCGLSRRPPRRRLLSCPPTGRATALARFDALS